MVGLMVVAPLSIPSHTTSFIAMLPLMVVARLGCSDVYLSYGGHLHGLGALLLPSSSVCSSCPALLHSWPSAHLHGYSHAAYDGCWHGALNSDGRSGHTNDADAGDKSCRHAANKGGALGGSNGSANGGYRGDARGAYRGSDDDSLMSVMQSQ